MLHCSSGVSLKLDQSACICGNDVQVLDYKQPCLNVKCADSLPDENCRCQDFTAVNPKSFPGIDLFDPSSIKILEQAINIRENTWGRSNINILKERIEIANPYIGIGEKEKAYQMIKEVSLDGYKFRETNLNSEIDDLRRGLQ